jgi:hypothetical protein
MRAEPTACEVPAMPYMIVFLGLLLLTMMVSCVIS